MCWHGIRLQGVGLTRNLIGQAVNALFHCILLPSQLLQFPGVMHHERLMRAVTCAHLGELVCPKASDEQCTCNSVKRP